MRSTRNCLQAICIATGERIRYNGLNGAERDGFNKKYIKLCLKGELDSHANYTWKTIKCDK